MSPATPTSVLVITVFLFSGFLNFPPFIEPIGANYYQDCVQREKIHRLYIFGYFLGVTGFRYDEFNFFFRETLFLSLVIKIALKGGEEGLGVQKFSKFLILVQ